MMKHAALVLAVLGVAPQARASGFLLTEQSAAALGRGGAATASVREPAAVWFNPAALVDLDRPAAAVTAAAVAHRTSFEPKGGGSVVESDFGFDGLPNVFASSPVWGPIVAGLGIYAPFGLTVAWPAGWSGQRISLETRIWSVATNPVLAVRLPGRLDIGGGFSLIRTGVFLRQGLPTEVGGEGVLEGGAWSTAFNVAARWTPLPGRLILGATYRSRSRVDFSGRADFSPQQAGSGFVSASIFQDQNARATLVLPDILTFGVAVRPLPRLEISADIQRVSWSTFDRLVVEFEKDTTPSTTIDRATRDPWTYRLGGQWDLPEKGLALRAGGFFDASATPPETLSPATPDADRIGVTLGLGYKLGAVTVDAAYMLMKFLPATAQGCSKPAANLPAGLDPSVRDLVPTDPLAGSTCPPEGTYNTIVHVLGVTVAFRTR